MITDTELRANGVRALSKALGHVGAERFVSLLLREPFDYTEWQRNLWVDTDVRQLSATAATQRASSIRSDAPGNTG